MLGRHDFMHLPNRPLLGELRDDFEYDVMAQAPTLDAPEMVARGSAIAVVTGRGQVLTQGHTTRGDYVARGAA